MHVRGSYAAVARTPGLLSLPFGLDVSKLLFSAVKSQSTLSPLRFNTPRHPCFTPRQEKVRLCHPLRYPQPSASPAQVRQLGLPLHTPAPGFSDRVFSWHKRRATKAKGPLSTGLKARRVHEVVADMPTPIKTRAFNKAAAGSFVPLFSCLLHRTVTVVTYTLLSGIHYPVPRAQ